MHWKRRSAIGIALLSLTGACFGQAGQLPGCASTPAAAVAAARAGQVSASIQTAGYRVESVRWDAAQRQTWAVIRSCDHTERPTLAMLADLPRGAAIPLAPAAFLPANAPQTASAPIAQANTSAAVVHAGEVVRLWRADSQAHIELMATAEETGTVGAKVRLRLMTPKDFEGQYAPLKYLAGIVRGPADVEMEQ